LFVASAGLIMVFFTLSHGRKPARPDLQKFCQEQNFSFLDAKSRPDITLELKDFHIFLPNETVLVDFCLQGSCHGLQWLICEFRSGQNPGKVAPFIHTVLCTRVKDIKMPNFFIGPKYFFGAHDAFAGYKDLSFEEEKERLFFRAYTVKTQDQPAMRWLLTREVMSLFETKVNRSRIVEARGEKIIFYESEKRKDPASRDKKVLLEEAAAVVGVLTGNKQ